MRFLLIVFFTVANAWASTDTDSRYGFKSLLVVATAPDPQATSALKDEVTRFFKEHSRFELSEFAFEDRLAVGITQAPLSQLETLFRPAKENGVDSVLLVEHRPSAQGGVLEVRALIFDPVEMVYLDTIALEGMDFSAVTAQGLERFAKSLPFDASVASRQGYRVILDRGGMSFRPGTRVAVFTLEETPSGQPLLKETGVIQIEQVEANLSFARVLAENRPLEIQKGNKVRFQTLEVESPQREIAQVRPSSISREVASFPDASTVEVAKDNEPWVFADAHLGFSTLGWGRTATTGEARQDGGFYPSAATHLHLKLVRDFFLKFNGNFSTGSTSGAAGSTLSSSASQIRLQGGYRILFGQQAPEVSFRVGISRTQFNVAEQPDVVGPTGVGFSGVLLGVGIQMPLNENWRAGLEMNGLLLGSVTETLTSGTPTQVSSWDFAVRGTYRMTAQWSFDVKMMFQTHAAQFSGVGTRPVALSSLRQDSQALLLGAAYVF